MANAATFEDFEELSPPRSLWAMAAIGAVALHAAVIAIFLLTYTPDDSDDDIGAPAIEVAIDMAAPRSEPSDLPPGPETEASAASPAQVDQMKKVEETNLPKDDPVETENPDRIVSTDAAKKPDEEKPDPAKVQTSASVESQAVEATAPPASEKAKEAPVSTAPVQGIGASAQRIKATWQKRLVTHLDRHKRYPSGGSRRSVTVLVAFALDRTGHIISTSIQKSSGDASFDAAALAMMQRSDPVPTPPALVADEGLSFTVPVVFRAQR